MKPMLPFDEALSLVHSRVRPLPAERVPLAHCLHRVLTEPVRSDVDSPPFDKSAMDGYACRRESLLEPLRILETVAAGRMPSCSVGRGECVKIMTGAPVPAGADCVVMVEHTERLPDGRVVVINPNTETNICRRGEDARVGDVLLAAGHRLGAASIATLAGAGCTQPLVSRLPVVTVLATGSELVPPERHPEGAQIRDSNSAGLCAQLSAMGVIALYGGIVPDTPDETLQAIRRAKSESDLLILSGGVSMGEFDHVPEALRAAGFRIHFDSVAMQPGRPTHFAESDATFCFGLPGNPVSTFVVLELLVKPFLLKMMGCEDAPLFVQGVMAGPLRRKPTARQSTYPVRIVDGERIEPLEYHGAAHIHALPGAQALLTLPPGSAGVEPGEKVRVRLL